MPIKKLTLAGLVITTLTVGCGSDGTDDGEQATQSNTSQDSAEGKPAITSKTSASAVDQQIFPEPKPMPPINFKPIKRAQPKSVEEATTTIEAIRKLYDSSNVPAAMNRDLTLEGVYEIAKTVKLMQSQLPLDIEWLKSIDGIKVPGADKFSAQSVDNGKISQLSRLEKYLPREIEHTVKYTREFIESSVKPQAWEHVRKAADVDMSNQSQVSNLLSRESLNQTRAQTINLVSEGFAAGKMFDEVLGIESDWETPKNEFREMVVRYREKLESAVDAIQPPRDIGDPALMEIAKQVVNDKSWRFGKPERIVVNAPKKPFAKDHYTVDFDERSVEKSPYRWEEFQMATIEKEGDKFYLYYNTLLHYSVGPHTVPTGKWVLGPRHKSAQISQANIKN